ncbi:MAG: hypothetical protein JXB18_01390 [Sedimentisphaerales bacterium]|nr:hypothetical protein [Sedimentisphaerales bacterium]
MKRAGIILIIVSLFGVFTYSVVSAPKPVTVQRAGQWTLDVQYSQPLQISVRLPGFEQPQRFWYLVLSLTNTTSNAEISLIPSCQLVTDTFKTIPAGQGVRKEVFDAIKLKHQGQYPFLESMDFADMTLRKGADNSRDIAIIWPEFDPNAKKISLFIAGLSNETAAINHPVKKDESGNPEKIYLQKTLQLNYANTTDPELRARAGLAFQDQNWVMR